MSDFNETLVKELGDYVRYLSLMGVQKANSGHPGLPLGCADLGIILYGYILNGVGNDPKWINRDRFILSAGHGSMLLYALNYLFDYKITLQDLANFRQLGSITAGHPEYELKDGIETTTGPLGQGFANAVGVAISSKMLESHTDFIHYNVYTIMGDGCTMEGITNEAASMAGHLGLDNLIAIYDDNNITIDGRTEITFSEDVQKRYEALGWYVQKVDGKNLSDLYSCLTELKNIKGRPKLLIVKTEIGEGLNELKGSHQVHGAPAGIDEITYFVQNSTLLNYVNFADRSVKEVIEEQLEKGNFFDKSHYQSLLNPLLDRREREKESWGIQYQEFSKKEPDKAEFINKIQNKQLSENLKKELLEFSTKKDATRTICSIALQLCAEHIPQIIGGSADLVGSTKATVKGSTYIQKGNFLGRNIAFGIREHAMGAIGNGLALDRTFIPFSSTFFTFVDYLKPSLRLAAIMQLKHLFIFTHDSIYVGEDGPTHEPIEHLGATRLIHGLYTFRPGNDIETGFSFLYFLENDFPVVILGTRQSLSSTVFNLEVGDRSKLYGDFKKGAYIFSDSAKPQIILAASGSELGTVMETKNILTQDGIDVRVVSLPCMELIEEASEEYRDKIFPSDVPVILVEAATHRSFSSWYAKNMHLVTMNSFGASGNGNAVANHFGFTPEKIVAKVKEIIN